MRSIESKRRLSLRLAGYLWREWVRPLGLFCLIVAPLKSAVVDWNWVPTGSMKPTILEGDLVLVNKLAYDLRVPFTTSHLASWGDPERGDVTVCFSPADGTRLVKRVVGLPGDTIAVRNHVLFVNHQPQAYTLLDPARYRREIYEDAQPIVAQEQLGERRHLVLALPHRRTLRDLPEYVVPAGQYFMLGDSRDNSADSRVFGPVPRAQIIGEATRVLLSFDPRRYLCPRLSRFGQPLE